MKGQPKLLTVPSFFNELTIKADLNGVTILKDGRFRKRYTGSKQFAVDINGQMHKASDLKKLLQTETSMHPGMFKTKKKGAATKPTPANLTENEVIEKKYTINKPEIRQRIYAMIAGQPSNRKELYFWTITFPLKTADQTIYKLFNTWLTKLRQKKMLQNYLWVAERQQNGTLHFHMCVPHRMNAKIANREMMICLCTASKAKQIDYSIHACKRYNGVDIAKNRKEKKVTNFALGKRGRRALTNYITKYITKNQGTFTHLAWHNSRGFSCLFTGVTFTVDEFVNVFKLSGMVRKYSAISNDFFQYHPWINGPPGTIEGELCKINHFVQNMN